MPSIVVRQEKQAISAATALGALTVTSTTNLYPGANAWVGLDNGTADVRVKILKIVDATHLIVRKWPTKKDADGVSYTLENFGAPSYGRSDMTAFNGAAHMTMETQSVPVDDSYSKRPVS